MSQQYLPLFPLNIVVFPNEKVNLHIFEPRYRQLVRNSLQDGFTFGIPVYHNNAVTNIGTEVEIISVDKQYENGELDIRTEGRRIFKLRDFQVRAPNCLYPGGNIEWQENMDDSNYLIKEEIEEQLMFLYEALKIQNPKEFTNCFAIAHHIGLSKEQEIALLQLHSESERQDMILDHLKQIVPVVIETERLKERVKMNGHFKNLGPLDLQ